MKSWFKLIFLILVLANCSCTKWFFGKDLASTDPFVNFDYLWNEVDRKYAYFSLKKVDWDSVRQAYRPKLNSGISQDSLFYILGSMLNELRDDHTNLMSPFNISRYNQSKNEMDNFDYKIVQKYYIYETEYTTGVFQHGFVKKHNIGYIRYKTFLGDISESDLDYILERYGNTIGLIIDLRENGGGNFVNILKLLSRFTNTKSLVMYNRTRNGPGREDFGPFEPFYISPSGKARYIDKPIIVLIDRGSYSASTFFALATKAMDNIYLIGDKTGGGGGLPNGGQLPNGWTYRFSITQSYDLKKVNYAEEGVEPDHYCQMNWLHSTRDEILELALDKITNFAQRTDNSYER
ncbi:MAG: S41 family peptidase [Bacteroidales bacterium]|jgi:C-terminal processing protease CtpA/Prc|nr:S41 family peptidase [Bacteroidales bacterium]MDD4617811.1 S41 family peptidase [Bacteroidales bacterium]